MELPSLCFLCFSSTIPFLLLLLLLLWLAQPRSSYNRRLPPSPPPLPIIGNLLDLGDQPHISLARLAQTHGPLMSLRLGTTTAVVISSPDMAREVLQRSDANFSSRSVPAAAHVLRHHEASIAWLPPGDRWRSLRRACSAHLFSPQQLKRSQPLRRRKLHELVSYVADQSARGLPVNIKAAAFNVVFSLISCALFSVDLAGADSKYAPKELKDLIEKLNDEVGGANLSDFFPFLAALDVQGKRRRFGALLVKMFAIIDEQIDRRLPLPAKEGSATNDRDRDFLGALLENESDVVDRHAVKSLISDLFTAGTDTSSCTVEWAMAELIRDPEAMAKARAELKAVVGPEDEVEESDIDRLPYLQAVVKEALRLHPPVPFLLPHRAEEAAELGGYVIPENTRVLVNVWAIGRDETIWPDADRFEPERFLEREVGFRGQDFELVPFGSGRRICPGLPLAVRTVHMMVAALVRRFEWRLPEGREVRDMDMTERFGVTLNRAEPLRAVPVPITVRV